MTAKGFPPDCQAVPLKGVFWGVSYGDGISKSLCRMILRIIPN